MGGQSFNRGTELSDSIEISREKSGERRGCFMSDYEMLMVNLTMLGIVTGLLAAYIATIRK